MTNGTMWYSLPSENEGSYYFDVSYSNQSYMFRADLGPMFLDCTTLYVSSGKIITLDVFQSSCQSALTNATGNFMMGETIHIPTNGTLTVFVKYYYFNSTSTTTFNFSNATQIHIQGLEGYTTVDASSNFTVLSNASSVQMGGTQNQSEGIFIKYVIGLKSGLNGTYTLNFGWLHPSLSSCAQDFHLVVGDGLPDYDWTGSCTGSLSNFYPINSQGFVPGYLFADIEGISY